LTELKLHLLNVWQAAAGPLERLGSAAGDLAEVLASAGRDPALGRAAGVLDEMGRHAAESCATLAAFHEQWTAEFAGLRSVEVDAHSAEILDVDQRARRQLGDVLHRTGKQLAAMRETINRMGELRIDEARHHVFHAALLRAFHTLQSARTRFEFAAGTIEVKNNFRLDAALTGAQGLRQRKRAQVAAIEDRLRSAATVRAKVQWKDAVAAARRAADERRAELDDVTGDILKLQDELNRQADEAASCSRARDRAQFVERRLEQLRSDRIRIESRLTDLRAARLSAAEPDIEITSCELVDRPINVAQRVRVGALASALTLLAVFLAQCWVARDR
jgi:hypothetical protein